MRKILVEIGWLRLKAVKLLTDTDVMKRLYRFSIICSLVMIAFPLFPFTLQAQDYHVGPGKEYSTIGAVPWESLNSGDRVLIHWRSESYREKWVIGRSGTELSPIIVRGIPSATGELPVINGQDAVTRQQLSYWNEKRGVIKIGGSSIPSEPVPSHIIIENLEIRSARPPFQFTNDSGVLETYAENAASIYVEIGQHLTLRNCIIHDSGNGIFIGNNGWQTRDIVIEGNHIYGNGIDGSIYHHNTYTSALGITYQNNFFGSLRNGALGNNLKDRSAGLTIRYNWIENGNRQLDLVDDDASTLPDPSVYNSTYVYGNILKEGDGEGNRQMVHYGGDSGNQAHYRKGTLYFYNNTLISTRSDRTTIFRLSTNDEAAEVFNNLVYTTVAGTSLSLADSSGEFHLYNNWFKSGWKNSHGTFNGTLNHIAPTLTGEEPGFVDFVNYDYQLSSDSPLLNQGASIPAGVSLLHPLTEQYKCHRKRELRSANDPLDIGAFEATAPMPGGIFQLLLLSP